MSPSTVALMVVVQARRYQIDICQSASEYPTNVVAMIQEGVMVGPASQQAAEIGRKFTNRQMPW